MLHGYARVLIGELRALQTYIPPLPHMPGRRPIIPLGETKYMPAPPGSWDSFAQAPWPPQDPGYTLGTSSRAGPSTDPLVGDGDDDDNDDVD